MLNKMKIGAYGSYEVAESEVEDIIKSLKSDAYGVYMINLKMCIEIYISILLRCYYHDQALEGGQRPQLRS